MIGIYKIENLKDGKIYIGQSSSIERRFKEHCFPSRYKGKIPIDIAIHEEGKQNFSFSVIEECSLEELNQRENYWIEFYDSIEKGYNCNLGGNQFSIGENNPNAKVTEEEVFLIRQIYNKQGSKKEAYKIVEGKTTWNNFEKIWQGGTWQHICPEVYTEENKKFYSTGLNCYANNSFSDEEINYWRQLYVNNTAKTLYDLSDKKVGYNTFQKMLNGTTYQYLPYYLKKLKVWVQPGEKAPIASESRTKKQERYNLFTKDEIIFYRKLYETQSAKDIYDQYKEQLSCTFSCFQNMLIGKTYSNLPYYNKKQSKWIE